MTKLLQRAGRWPVSILAGSAGLWAVKALAADGPAAKGPSEAIFVAQVVALLFTGRLFGEIALRLRQPAVVGQLIAGIVLGPSVFGLLAPHVQALVFPADHAQKAMIDGVAQLGVLLLLLLTGMETDVALVRRVGRPAASVSLCGIAVPFACGVLVGLFVLPDSLVPTPEKRLVTALFLGTALSISSIKIVAMVIDEMHFMRRNLGQIIVASAIIDDTVGWIIIAVTFGLARPAGLDLAHLGLSVGGTLVFLALSATLGRRVVAALMRWANDELASDLAVVTVILIVMGVMALITEAIGVHTVLGAFVAGVLVGQSPILTRKVEGEIRGLVTALFAPIFFGLAGLGTDLTILKDPVLLALTAGLVLVASLGKFGGAFAGGALGRLTPSESLALALGMNARGSTEVIVATIGLGIGALNHSLFTMIVTMAVLTTTAMPPTLRWALARLPLGREEADRLKRENFEHQGFVGNIERVLLARDAGANGRLAARLAGLLGHSRAFPVTVMPAGAGQGGDLAADVVAAATGARFHGEPPGAPPDVALRLGTEGDPAAALTAEGRKGYGLVMVGAEPARRKAAGLDPQLMGLLASFDGVRALVLARGRLQADPARGRLKILVPATGTQASQRAAELAFALAHAAGAEVAVLHVGKAPQAGQTGTSRRTTALPRSAILASMTAMAERFAVEAKPVERVAADRVAAVLGQVRRAGDTLIVLGVQPRASDDVPFGQLAAGLLEAADCALLLVIGPGAVGEAADGLRAGVEASAGAS